MQFTVITVKHVLAARSVCPVTCVRQVNTSCCYANVRLLEAFCMKCWNSHAQDYVEY